MSPDKQRIAIASSCGWEIDPDLEDGELMGTSKNGHWDMLPDYPNDPNAMHEAELHNWHDEDFIERYENELQMTYVRHCGYSAAAYWWMSSAKIRAEAFLRTIGKWESE